MQAFLFGSVEDPAADAAWDAFWGFDCVAREGLCERAYAHLRLPETAWPGLKQLPQVPPPALLHCVALSALSKGQIMAACSPVKDLSILCTIAPSRE